MAQYFGNFTDYHTMIAEWGDIQESPVPTPDEVLFASYGAKDYEGDAIVIFQHDGKLYEVVGGHCSCHGLDESGYKGGPSQWEPEETSWKALAMRTLPDDQHEPEALIAFKALVEAHQ